MSLYYAIKPQIAMALVFVVASSISAATSAVTGGRHLI